MGWATCVACMGESRVVHRVLVGKLEGKRPFGRPRRRWKDNIKMGFQAVLCEGMDWIDLALGRNRWCVFVNEVTNRRVP